MPDVFRVIAIISAFNEGDIISPVIGHLVENDVEVYLIDNHSTDDTVEQAKHWLGRGLLQIESFPNDGPTGSEASCPFNWTEILQRKEELARELPADWVIHHDADEIRESPWPGMALKEAIRWVDTLGYNCIDFQVLNFPPIDDGFRQGDDPRVYFTHYENPAEFDSLQVKCWKATKISASLVPTGGHDARFSGRRVFPIQFLLRHYPIRGQRHGMKKVFAERKSRFLQSERSQGWHIQYDHIKDETHSFLRDPAKLRPFDLDRVRLELLLPDRILRSLAERFLRTDEELNRLEVKKQDLENQLASLARDHDRLKQREVGLQGEQEEQRGRVGGLERERDELQGQVTNLESVRDELRARAGELERGRDGLQAEVTNLEIFQRDLEEQNRDLEREITDIRNSRSWRWTLPLRRIFDMIRAFGIRDRG